MSAQQGFAEPGRSDKGRSAEMPAHPHAAGRLRLPYLDGLRALAAGYVVCFHAVLGFSGPELAGPWRVLLRLFAFGHEAVAVFIVLSGYCLMLPVVTKQPERLTVAFAPFLRRRAFRILPPYFGALALSLALIAAVPVLRTRSGTIWDDSLPGLDLAAILSHVLVVHNWSPTWGYQINGPFWSVASEWQIYFFFPLVLLPVWRRFGMLSAIATAALLGFAPLSFARSASMIAIPWYLMLFSFGMASAAIGFAPQPLPRWLRGHVRWSWWCAALWLGCISFSTLQPRIWFGFKPIADSSVGLATASLLIHLTARAATPSRGRLLRILESRPLVRLGHFSYSVYLTHLPVLALLYCALRGLGWSAAPRSLALLGGGAVASLLVGYAFHVGIERHFMVQPSASRNARG